MLCTSVNLLSDDYFHQNCRIFQVMISLPVCQKVIHRHFYEDFMTFSSTKVSYKLLNKIQRLLPNHRFNFMAPIKDYPSPSAKLFLPDIKIID